MTKHKLFNAVSDLDIKKKDQEYEIPGVLGFTLAGENTVQVPNRDSFVYVRLRNNQNELIQAFNDQVSPVYDLPVLVVRDTVDKGRYKVVGRDLGQYQHWGTSSYQTVHGNQHSFNPDSGGGGDIVWVFGRQFMPLLGYPSGSSAAGSIMIHSYTYYDGSSWNYVGNTGTTDLTTYKPTGSSARIVLVYINQFGNPGYRAGSFFNESITGTAEIVPYIPSPPTGTAFPVSAVRLVSGTSTIAWDNLYDVRPFYDLSGTSSGLGGAGGGAPDDAQYVTLALDGDLLAERQLVTGTHTTITDGGANANVSVNVSPQGVGSGLDADTVDGDHATAFASGSHTHYQASILDLQHALPITEDGVFQATGTAIDFGANMNVAVTGSVVFVSSVGGGGGGGDLLIYEDGAFQVTGTALNFEDGLIVFVTGSIAHINLETGTYGDMFKSVYDTDDDGIVNTAVALETDQMEVLDRGVAGNYALDIRAKTSNHFSKLLMYPNGVMSSGDTALQIYHDTLLYGSTERFVALGISHGVPEILLASQDAVGNGTMLPIRILFENNVGGSVSIIESVDFLPSGSVYFYNYLDVQELTTVPPNPASNVARFYSRDDGGITKLYYKRPNGTEIELGAATPTSNALSILDDSVFQVTGTAISLDRNLDVAVTGSIAYINGNVDIYDNGASIGAADKLSFNNNLDVTNTGSSVFVSSIQCGTYQRVGQPNPLINITGTHWQVPGNLYASGSLAVFQDGNILTIETDYEEQFWVSGTYLYKSAPATGTVHMIMWGVPCQTQTQPATGTSAFALQDSDSVLLLDSDDIQLLDSDG